MKNRKTNIFDRALAQRGNPHDHPTRKLYQRRAQADVDSYQLAERVIHDTGSRRRLSSAEWERLGNTMESLEFVTQLQTLLRGAVALYFARMHPDDRDRAGQEIKAATAAVDRRLERFKDERSGAAALARRIDEMFTYEPMPELEEFLETVLRQALGDGEQAK